MNKEDNKVDVESIFKRHQLINSVPRFRILSLIAVEGLAISQPSLMRKTKNISRTTLYRILLTLEHKEIIYKIYDTYGIAHYAVSPLSFKSKSNKRILYLHFYCKACKKIYCFNEPFTAQVRVRKKFNPFRFEISIVGTCALCNKKHLKVFNKLKNNPEPDK